MFCALLFILLLELSPIGSSSPELYPMQSVNSTQYMGCTGREQAVQSPGKVYSPTGGVRRAHGGPDSGDPGEHNDGSDGDNYGNTGGTGDGNGNAGDPEGYVPLGDGWIMMLFAALFACGRVFAHWRCNHKAGLPDKI